jgi:site-specific recombinase XerD
MDKIKYLTKPQITALLNAITNVRDKAMWTVAYWRGLRVSELGLLMLTDWNQSSNRLYVRRLKGSTSGEFLLHKDEAHALADWLIIRGDAPGPLFVSRQRQNRQVLTRQRLSDLMVHYCELAGIPRALAHMHVLRHSIAVHLLEQGVDVLLVKDWLGHRSIESTMVYATVTNKAREYATAKMYAEGTVEGAIPLPVESTPPPPAVAVDWAANSRAGRRKPKPKAKPLAKPAA